VRSVTILKLKTIKMEQKSEISINKIPSFSENWHEGYIEYDGVQHKFWLIDPKRQNPEDYDYELEVRWFFKNVPREVRMMYSLIIESFKQKI
jgi:hypothetical protein